MTDLKDIPLNFLDVETTGGSFGKDRLIEIYVSKVVNGKEIDRLHTLVNPGFRPDQFILRLTSIKYKDLLDAPKFEDFSARLESFLGNEILIAHNARFDFSFIKGEFNRLGIRFNNQYCCTVKLSRFLYPIYRKHNLDSIIQRLNYPNGDRHRASYDTEVIKEFFYQSQKNFDEETFIKAFKKSVKKAAIPKNLVNYNFKSIPEKAGVYFFRDEKNEPLYIGMSKNLRRRVLDHLYSDTTYTKDSKINRQVKNIDSIETEGELGACLRESFLIKKYQPIYNHALRRKKSLIKLKSYEDEKGYLRVKIDTKKKIDINQYDEILGVFKSKQTVKKMLEGLAKEYGLCPNLLGLQNYNGACFSYQLGHCKGGCIGEIKSEIYNKTLLKAFKKYRVDTWAYKAAIKLVEGKDEFLVHNWNLIAYKKTSEQDWSRLNLVEGTIDSFSYDNYKIIKRFIKKEDISIKEVEIPENIVG